MTTTSLRVRVQRGSFGDEGCKALTDMLRVNKHISVVSLDGWDDDQLHDKFSALALPTVAIEKFTTSVGRAFICASASFHLTMSPRSAPASHIVGLTQWLHVNGSLRQLNLCKLCFYDDRR